MDERVRQAGLLFERAIFGGDAGPLDGADRKMDAAEAELAIARGKLMHARFLLLRDKAPDDAPNELACFEHAAQLYRALGDARGEAEALFWVGCFHQVVRGDNEAAEPLLERSLELAREAGDTGTAAEALRHLGIAAHRAGHFDVARQRLAESTQLRRESGHLPGVASNLIGLAYIAGAQNRPEDARAHLAEARVIAQDHSAHRLLDSITEAQAELSKMSGPS
jgi:tetratricopeptide (TPR) repeat protein